MNRPGSRAGRWAVFAVLALACAAAGIRPLVLEIGRRGPRIWVQHGDLISLHYIQSMYGVPVVERLRVEDGFVSARAASGTRRKVSEGSSPKQSL